MASEGDGRQTQSLGVLLLPDFNAMATMALLDPLRAANYLSGDRLYSWQFLSPEGGEVRASNGAVFGATLSLAERPRFDSVFVSASWTPEAHAERSLLAWLRELARAGTVLGGIDTGAVVLAQAGLLDGYAATAHYEHLDGLGELYPKVEVRSDLFVIDRDRLSCAGGMACADLALELIKLTHGHDLANAAARYIFHDRLRLPGESQRHPPQEPLGRNLPSAVLQAILVMERNVETPLNLTRIAEEGGLSVRHLERLFKAHTGEPPASYYLNLRLDRARGLVTQTNMRVLDIAVACGFSSPEHFSRVYRRRFGLSPRRDRVVGRIPFQFRAQPLPRSAGPAEES